MVHSLTFAQLFCSSCWKGSTEAAHFGVKFYLNRDSCQTNFVFLCPILELKLIGLDYVHVVPVHVENEQDGTRIASNLVSIFLLS